ncbi:MAG: hypothetical protein ACK56I_05065, partial [bacterium]
RLARRRVQLGHRGQKALPVVAQALEDMRHGSVSQADLHAAAGGLAGVELVDAPGAREGGPGGGAGGGVGEGLQEHQHAADGPHRPEEGAGPPLEGPRRRLVLRHAQHVQPDGGVGVLGLRRLGEEAPRRVDQVQEGH